MASQSVAVAKLVIPWAVEGVGFCGEIEVDQQSMPNQQWESATVGDLVQCLDSYVKSLGGETPLTMRSLSLYGSALKPDKALRPLLPALLAPYPCALAVALPWCPSSMAMITIRTLTGKVFTIECSLNSTVEELKALIAKEDGTPPEPQRLVYAGRELEDVVRLKQYEIVSGSTVHLVLNMRGGGAPFANVADNTLLTEIAFGEGPKWRACGEGLNIEGRCENRACVAHGRMVICPNRFSSFNLTQEDSRCPMCYSKIKPVTCGFFNCEWKFDGVLANGGCHVSSPWQNAEGHKYHRFESSEARGSTEWDSLLITVMPLRTFLPTATRTHLCCACNGSLASTPRAYVYEAACCHCYHQLCFADLAGSHTARGALLTCLGCGR